MVDELDDLPDGTAADSSWSAHLPGQEFVSAYLVSRYAAQYRVIVEVLLSEQDSSLTGLSFDEVAAALRRHLAEGLTAQVVDELTNERNLQLESARAARAMEGDHSLAAVGPHRRRLLASTRPLPAHAAGGAAACVLE